MIKYIYVSPWHFPNFWIKEFAFGLYREELPKIYFFTSLSLSLTASFTRKRVIEYKPEYNVIIGRARYTMHSCTIFLNNMHENSGVIFGVVLEHGLNMYNTFHVFYQLHACLAKTTLSLPQCRSSNNARSHTYTCRFIYYRVSTWWFDTCVNTNFYRNVSFRDRISYFL